MKVLAVIHGIIIHYFFNKMSNHMHTNTQELFMAARCLSPYCCHFNKFNRVPVCVCKDATSGTKANSEADVPNEENMAREGGIIQLVSGEVNVL